VVHKFKPGHTAGWVSGEDKACGMRSRPEYKDDGDSAPILTGSNERELCLGAT
jgi:hypothetical protein